MRYRQIIIESKKLFFDIKHIEIEVEITNKKIEKLEASDKDTDRLRAEQKKLGLVNTKEALEAAKQELNYLIELSKDYRHYTPDEIEANQENYWELRLTRQATTDRMALEQGINVGNLESMMNAGLVQKELTR
jgi:hypothetical protein